MKSFYYIFIPTVLFFFSCKKKDFPDTVTPVNSDFYFNGTIADSTVSIKSGIDNYYMYSSYTFGSDMLYRFTADLRQAGCTNCKNSLQITINDFRYTSGNEGSKIDSALAPKSYPILGTPFYAVQFRSVFNQQASSYEWNFGDNRSSRESNPLHIYNSIGNYSVSLKINSTSGCQQYISNIEKIRYPFINSKISAISNSANAMSFNALISGSSSSYNYYWSFGDGDTSTLANPAHNYNIAGTYPVSLRVVNSQQDTVYARYNVATQTNPMPCLTNYSIESVTQVVNPKPLSVVVIKWTDANGDVYTSDHVLQPTESYFRILSVEEYDLNEKGERTKRIKVKFSCKVYHGSNTKQIDNAEAVISVSYK